MMRFQRIIQIISLVVFLVLLRAAIYETLESPDFFLGLDPALAVITAISGRTLFPAFIPAMIVLILAPVLGRVFCGYICPMGTTLDGGDKLFSARKKKIAGNRSEFFPRTVKYIVLIFMLGASVLGVSFIFAGSPLSLITRFYGLVIFPALSFLAEKTLELIQPIAYYLDLQTLLYAQIKTPRFATQVFILFFFIALFASARFSPRFWCRYLCPSGALLALVSKKPLIRRHVSEDCTECGKCARSCPMGAIPDKEPETTLSKECIVCRTCENICPVSAVSFRIESKITYPLRLPKFQGNRKPDKPDRISLTRRGFIYSGLAGTGAALISITGLDSVHGKPGEGQVLPELLRPPGALPEPNFLSQCVRCGECMAACPTNTLQPIWLDSGFAGLFSPRLVPRRKFCDPKCNRCGEVCPTGAIRNLTKKDRIWAKTGTAVIFRRKCLAWEYRKSCMVCDEVCPFDAIEFKKEAGNPFAVPRVKENKCAGCGYCEYFCPVRNQAAIVVTPMGALRLSRGSYEKEGRSRKLELLLKPKDTVHGLSTPGMEYPEGSAPGFEDAPGFENAPGFEDIPDS
ncbi:MAG: 4Fe-4S dicluster domain-containing protein [Desulfobacterales bacterium]|nr:4Fe-4S dicluster domain-containing protein [Desulfobacterales bacterium]